METIAEASSEAPGKDRWTELTLRRDDRGYELEVRGLSRVPGESTRTRVTWHPDRASVLRELRHPAGGYSRLAQELVEKMVGP